MVSFCRTIASGLSGQKKIMLADATIAVLVHSLHAIVVVVPSTYSEVGQNCTATVGVVRYYGRRPTPIEHLGLIRSKGMRALRYDVRTETNIYFLATESAYEYFVFFQTPWITGQTNISKWGIMA